MDTKKQNQRAKALFSAGKLEEAKNVFEQIVQNDPDNFETLNNLGAVSYALGDEKSAEAHFLRALEINKDHAEALNNIIILYQNANRWHDAVLYLERFALINHKDTDVLNRLAAAYLKTDNTENTRIALKKSLKLNPNQEIVKESLRELKKSDFAPNYLPTLNSFRVAFAEINITPNVSEQNPVFLQGMGGPPRRATAVSAPLMMQLLLLEDDHFTKVFFVTADLFGFGPEIVGNVRAIVAQWGIEPEGLILNASHTHYAPGTISHASKSIGPFYSEYAKHIIQTIGQQLPILYDRLEECKLSWGKVEAQIGVSRRLKKDGKVIFAPNSEGYYDKDTPFILFHMLKTDKKVLLVNHGCHPTGLGSENFISADYPAYMRNALKSNGFVDGIMFLQGGAGSTKETISTKGDVRFCENSAGARVNGEFLATQIINGIEKGLQPIEGSLFCTRRQITLPLKPIPAPNVLAQVRNNEDIDALVREWAKGLLNRFPSGDIPNRLAIEIQLVVVGDKVSFVALPGEPVAELARDLRMLNNMMNATFILGYTNGLIGYLPTDDMIEEGGYEAGASHFVYLQPSALDAGSESAITSATEKCIRTITDKGKASGYGRYHLAKKEQKAFFVLSAGRCGTMTLAHLLNTATNARVWHHPQPDPIKESLLAYWNHIDKKKAFWKARYPILHKTWSEGLVHGETDLLMTPFCDTIASEIPDSKFIVLVRNPRDFVRSGMRRNYYYGHPWDFGRLRPKEGTEEFERWNKLDQFEKICWLWRETYEHILKTTSKIPKEQVFLLAFEGLVMDESKTKELFEFLGLDGFDSESIKGILDEKFNAQRAGHFAKPEDWPSDLSAKLWNECGKIAAIFGYRDDGIKNRVSDDSPSGIKKVQYIRGDEKKKLLFLKLRDTSTGGHLDHIAKHLNQDYQVKYIKAGDQKEGVPTKLLYLAFLYAAEKQIFSKIAQQLRVIKELNPDSHCYIVGTNSGRIPIDRYGLNFIDLIETKDNPSRQDYFSACEKIIVKLAPDIIYFRYPIFDYWTYEFVSKFNNVVFEHQTIAEYEFHPQLAEIEKKFGPYILGKAKGIVGVTEEILKYEQGRSLAPKPGYVMANGIDNSLPMAKPNYPSNEIHLFSTAYFSPWHGLDRLIEGMAHYKEHGKIKLHLIGYGREITRYQEMIKQYDLEKNVFFHGFLGQKQIGAIAERCQIGVGALGVHRKGLTQSVALKNREYCLRGIPFVYAGEDVDFHPDLPFVRIFPANDTPINIQAIVDFSEQISNHPEIRTQERQYALDNLIWDKKIPGLVQFLTGLAQEPAINFSLAGVPKPVEYYVGKINEALKRQDVKLADEISQTAISEYAFQPYLWFIRGSVLRQAGKYQEAISALRRSNKSPESLFESLYVYRLLNQAENAEKTKQDLLQKYPHWQDKVIELLKDTEKKRKLNITYLISSILGVTGGNITLLNQVNALSERGHHVTIVTYTEKPQWMDIKAEIIKVPGAEPMASFVPPSHVAISTYFSNTAELVNIDAPVKIYYAQGDQYVFEDDTPSPNPKVENIRRRMRNLSKASYLYPGVYFIPNSRNLADAVERAYGKKPDAILPVCTDKRIFRPLQKPVVGSKWRILIVGPDRRGSDTEPLTFKGIADIRKALEKLLKRCSNFTAIRMSNTGPDIFRDFPCEFYFSPSNEMKTFLYGTAHILVYASHYDSCPRPPQEAMAAGTAVVCTATSGAMEYCCDNENCLLVPIKSPDLIADAIERLIKDGSLRERLIKGGFNTARDFPAEREWNELEGLLYRFMEESGNKFEDAEALADKDEPALYQNVQSLIDAGQSCEAIKALKELLILYPDFALAHNDLGVLYYKAGKKEDAFEHYKRAAELQPKNINFQKNLADFYYVERGKVQEAMEIYIKILSLDPRDIECLLMLGHISVSMEKTDDAKVFYMKAKALSHKGKI